jgi:hypothetical protein
MPRQRIQAARRKIDEIIQKARKMDELDYMLWREEFAKQLLELSSPSKRAGKRDARRQKGPELSRAGMMLLDEGMLKALETRIEALKKAEKEKKEEPQEN